MDDYTADKILKVVEAMDNPMGVIDRMARGAVTREEIEAVKVIAPALFAEVQNNIMGAMIDRQINPDYKGRLTLGLVFGIPADESLMPSSISMSQTIYKDPEEGLVKNPGKFLPRNVPKRPIEGYANMRLSREERREGRDPGAKI